MEKKFRYFKNNKGTLFVDPKSGLKVTNNNITRIEASKVDLSKSARDAIGRAILEVEEAEYNAWIKKQGQPVQEDESNEPTEVAPVELPEDLSKATKETLLAWVKEHSEEIDDDDLKGIEKKTKDQIIEIIEQYN
jgi:hypothetical protein